MLIVAPDEATRQRWGPWFMSLPLQYGLRWGEVWGTDDTSGVAVWVPPDSGEMGLGRMLRIGLARMPIRLGMASSLRFMQSLSKTEPFHKDSRSWARPSSSATRSRAWSARPRNNRLPESQSPPGVRTSTMWPGQAAVSTGTRGLPSNFAMFW